MSNNFKQVNLPPMGHGSLGVREEVLIVGGDGSVPPLKRRKVGRLAKLTPTYCWRTPELFPTNLLAYDVFKHIASLFENQLMTHEYTKAPCSVDDGPFKDFMLQTIRRNLCLLGFLRHVADHIDQIGFTFADRLAIALITNQIVSMCAFASDKPIQYGRDLSLYGISMQKMGLWLNKPGRGSRKGRTKQLDLLLYWHSYGNHRLGTHLLPKGEVGLPAGITLHDGVVEALTKYTPHLANLVQFMPYPDVVRIFFPQVDLVYAGEVTPSTSVKALVTDVLRKVERSFYGKLQERYKHKGYNKLVKEILGIVDPTGDDCAERMYSHRFKISPTIGNLLLYDSQVEDHVLDQQLPNVGLHLRECFDINGVISDELQRCTILTASEIEDLSAKELCQVLFDDEEVGVDVDCDVEMTIKQYCIYLSKVCFRSLHAKLYERYKGVGFNPVVVKMLPKDALGETIPVMVSNSFELETEGRQRGMACRSCSCCCSKFNIEVDCDQCCDRERIKQGLHVAASFTNSSEPSLGHDVGDIYFEAGTPERDLTRYQYDGGIVRVVHDVTPYDYDYVEIEYRDDYRGRQYLDVIRLEYFDMAPSMVNNSTEVSEVKEPISGTLAVGGEWLSKFAKAFTFAPRLATITEVLSLAAFAASDIARRFGYSRPLDLIADEVVISSAPSLALTDVNMPGKKLSLWHDQSVTINLQPSDLMTHSELLKNFVISSVETWSSMQGVGAVVAAISVNPCMANIDEASGCCALTPSALVASQYGKWHGEMHYMIEVIAPPSFSGALCVYYEPAGVVDPATLSTSTNRFCSLDLSRSKKLEITVGWGSNEHALNTTPNAFMNLMTGYYPGYCNGQLYITVQSPLLNMLKQFTEVDVVIWTRASEKMLFFDHFNHLANAEIADSDKLSITNVGPRLLHAGRVDNTVDDLQMYALPDDVAPTPNLHYDGVFPPPGVGRVVQPTSAPTPTSAPAATQAPTMTSNSNPTVMSWLFPTIKPTVQTVEPSVNPVASTNAPTRAPTTGLTKTPTTGPTKNPTWVPTRKPTRRPTSKPTLKPSSRPTNKLTLKPTSTCDFYMVPYPSSCVFPPNLSASGADVVNTKAPLEQLNFICSVLDANIRFKTSTSIDVKGYNGQVLSRGLTHDVNIVALLGSSSISDGRIGKVSFKPVATANYVISDVFVPLARNVNFEAIYGDRLPTYLTSGSGGYVTSAGVQYYRPDASSVLNFESCKDCKGYSSILVTGQSVSCTINGVSSVNNLQTSGISYNVSLRIGSIYCVLLLSCATQAPTLSPTKAPTMKPTSLCDLPVEYCDTHTELAICQQQLMDAAGVWGSVMPVGEYNIKLVNCNVNGKLTHIEFDHPVEISSPRGSNGPFNPLGPASTTWDLNLYDWSRDCRLQFVYVSVRATAVTSVLKYGCWLPQYYKPWRVMDIDFHQCVAEGPVPPQYGAFPSFGGTWGVFLSPTGSFGIGSPTVHGNSLYVVAYTGSPHFNNMYQPALGPKALAYLTDADYITFTTSNSGAWFHYIVVLYDTRLGAPCPLMTSNSYDSSVTSWKVGSPTTEDAVCRLCAGEYPVSLRSLLKYMRPIPTVEGSAFVVTNLYHNGEAKLELLHLLTLSCLGTRGSVNVLYTIKPGTSGEFNIYAVRGSTQLPTLEGIDVIRRGFEYLDSKQSSMIVNHPYYSCEAFHTMRSMKGVVLFEQNECTRAFVALNKTTGQADASPVFSCVSIGEDFSLFHFLGVPILKIS